MPVRGCDCKLVLIVRKITASMVRRNKNFSFCGFRGPTCTTGFGALLVAFLTLTLAGCRNPPPYTGIQGPSQAVRRVKTWLAAGVGQYDGQVTGTLDYRHRIIPIIGHLNLTNAYHFILCLQSVNGRTAFILRRNWAGGTFYFSAAGILRFGRPGHWGRNFTGLSASGRTVDCPLARCCGYCEI